MADGLMLAGIAYLRWTNKNGNLQRADDMLIISM